MSRGLGRMRGLGFLLGLIPQRAASVTILATDSAVHRLRQGGFVLLHADASQLIFGSFGPARVPTRMGYGFCPSGVFVAKL